MKYAVVLFYALIVSLAFADPIKLNDGDRVAFVGGTFTEREAEFSTIETYLTLSNPNKNIIFRNYGWAADTVKGESRGYFKIKEGYNNLLNQVSDISPNVIILSYGANAAWDGPEGLDKFIKDYEKLITDLATQNKARIILLTTPRQEKLGGDYPNPKVYNQNLSLYFSAIEKLAAKNKLELHNLFKEIEDVTGLTSNSVHLNEKGYTKVAKALSSDIDAVDRKVEIDISSNSIKSSHGQVQKLQTSDQSVSFELKQKQLASLSSKLNLQVKGLKQGKYELVLGNKVLKVLTAEALSKGIITEVSGQESFIQKLIVDKNELYFHSWRPQNTTYLFGFRKHEQGQNAAEIPKIKEIVKSKDAEISSFKKTQFIKWQLRKVKEDKERVLTADEKLILPPEEEMKTLKLPEDLEISLFAAEPMVINPTNMNWDGEGRLWVACAPDYPQIMPGKLANDQIVVLEDTDNDGKADKKTVFVDGLLLPTAILPGNGGVYVANSTEFVHYKDTDGDGKADEKRIILSGFGTEDTHHILHTPYWGQDGLLYVNQSIYIHSHVETPWGVQRLMAGGIWQYEPFSEKLSVFARGLLNCWGHRMDEYGQSFATDGAGREGINYVFPDVAQVTAYQTRHIYPGLNPGQPKHCGLEIISGSHFPEKYQGRLLANDFRGHRTNSFKLQDNESSYVSTQLDDIVSTGAKGIDRLGNGGGFRPVDLRMGPDGALYVADWSNIIIQHGEVDFRDKRRDKVHGRIWRITAKNRPLVKKRKIVGASVSELLANLSSSERWVIDHSKRELIERGPKAVLPALDKWLQSKQTDLAKLHGLWLKVGLNVPDQSTINNLINSSDGKVRAAVVRIAAQWSTRLPGFEQVIAKAIQDDHARVRLEGVHATRSLRTTKAVELALLALDKPMDKTIDYSLKLTVMDLEDEWVGKTLFSGNIKHLSYAVSASKSEKALKSLYKAYQEGKVPAESELQAIRLIGELGGKVEQKELYIKLANAKLSTELKHVILSSLITASERKGIKPDVNHGILIKQINDKAVQAKVLKLLALWKVSEAQDQLIQLAKSGNSKAIDCLASIGGKAVVTQLEKLVKNDLGSELSLVSASAITAIDRNKGIALGVASLGKLQKGVDSVVFFNKALGFKNGPAVLTKALAGNKIDSSAALTGIRRANTIGRDVTALVAALTKAGELKPMKQLLSKEELATMVKAVQERGNPSIGEDIYRKRGLACISCHAIGGAGPKIGPDLISIGASAPVDYIIESILQPSKKIKEGYHMTMVMTNDGKVLAGAEVSSNKSETIIRDALGNTQKVATRNIKSKQINNMSMMPPGLTGSLTDEEFIHLVSFLSQLGKEGDFKLSNKRYVTSFFSLTGKKTYSSSQSMNSKFWEQVDTYPWMPALTKVSGFLPLKESEGINSKPVLLKFELDVLKAGKLSIKLSDGKNIRLINGKPEPFFIDAKTGMASTEVSKGKVSIIVCIKPNFASKSLRLELIDNESTALVKFID